ncbi:hypothetical protein PL371_11875 [Tenacibaculum maritimum]|nr:hypothetical protein [Tenacibaculum maritimum]MDB0612557.1 hypothetical protein [Tenacibaculum maritimum]
MNPGAYIDFFIGLKLDEKINIQPEFQFVKWFHDRFFGKELVWPVMFNKICINSH